MLQSEKLVDVKEASKLIESLISMPEMESHMALLAAIKDSIEESDRYIREEAVPTEGKYEKLKDDYRKRFTAGCQGNPPGMDESINQEQSQPKEYTDADLYAPLEE